MIKWVLLACAVVCEVGATLALKAAIGAPAWYIAVVAGYAGGFVLLAAMLRLGAPIGTVYGIWSACGVALTAILGALVFAEPFTWGIAVGVAIIILGVVLVETGGEKAPEAAAGQFVPAAVGAPVGDPAPGPSTGSSVSAPASTEIRGEDA